MRKIILNIKTAITKHPAKTVAGNWLFSTINTDTSITVDEVSVENPTHSVSLDDGNYKSSAVRMDVDKKPLGAVVEVSFSLAPDLINIVTAGSLAVDIGDPK